MLRVDAMVYLDLRNRLQVDEISFDRDRNAGSISWAWRIGDKWHQATTDNDGPEVTIAALQALIRLTE